LVVIGVPPYTGPLVSSQVVIESEFGAAMVQAHTGQAIRRKERLVATK
jgi:hypothetical protein